MSKILLIGGNGYIGTRLYNHLNIHYDVDVIYICWFGTSIKNTIVKAVNPQNIERV